MLKNNKNWIEQEPINFSVQEIKSNDVNGQFIVDVCGVSFNCLWIGCDGDKKIIVSLGGGGRKGKKYPFFQRWKWKVDEYSILCIDDPMYIDFPKKTHVMWYWGDKENSYLIHLSKIVLKICELKNINKENVVFVGDSGGGYAALFLANLLGTKAIAFNPQIVPYLWSEKITKSMKDIRIDIKTNDKYGRNHLVLDNEKSRFLITVNNLSKLDVLQTGKLLQTIGFRGERKGIKFCGNYIFWFYESKGVSVHRSFPIREDFNYLLRILENMGVYDCAEEYLTTKLESSIKMDYQARSMSKYIYTELKEKVDCCDELKNRFILKEDDLFYIRYDFVKRVKDHIVFEIREGQLVCVVKLYSISMPMIEMVKKLQKNIKIKDNNVNIILTGEFSEIVKNLLVIERSVF